jgi:hypothetical protein
MCQYIYMYELIYPYIKVYKWMYMCKTSRWYCFIWIQE